MDELMNNIQKAPDPEAQDHHVDPETEPDPGAEAQDAPESPEETVSEPNDQPQKEPVLDKNGKPKKSLGREILEWVLTIAAAVAIALVIRTLLFEPVSVDGRSMQDTLQDREIMFVTKPEYVFGGSPQRFDVVICHYPDRGMTNFVKRVVGLPGDTVAFTDGYLYVNGEKYDEPYINDAYRNGSFRNMDGVVVPAKGDKLSLDWDGSRLHLLLNGEAWLGSTITIDAVSKDNHKLSIDAGLVSYDGKELDESTLEAAVGTEFAVTEDYYFLCGDHRNNSNDSRYIGPVRRSMIRGHVRYVFWPLSDRRAVE